MTGTDHVDFYEDKAGEWRWRARSANGEIVAEGEAHADQRDAERAFDTAAEVITAIRNQRVAAHIAENPSGPVMDGPGMGAGAVT